MPRPELINEPWRLGPSKGEHDEMGYTVTTLDGRYILSTPGVYMFGDGVTNSLHQPEAWHAYTAFANRLVADHNLGLLRDVIGRLICYSAEEFECDYDSLTKHERTLFTREEFAALEREFRPAPRLA